MTNQIPTPAVEQAAVHSATNLVQIVLDGGPAWPHFVFLAWTLLFVAAPLMSVALLVWAKRSERSEQQNANAKRIVKSMVLMLAALTLVQSLHGLAFAFEYLGSNEMGAAGVVMLSYSISHSCWFLLFGTASVAISLLCAIWFPTRARKTETPTTR